MLLLARAVRTFGTEEKETGRYRRCLAMLRRISIRQATAYLFYLVTNASLFNLTKARSAFDSLLPARCEARADFVLVRKISSKIARYGHSRRCSWVSRSCVGSLEAISEHLHRRLDPWMADGMLMPWTGLASRLYLSQQAQAP